MWARIGAVLLLFALGFIGATAFDVYQASRRESASILLTSIGTPFCGGQRRGSPYKSFFALAEAQTQPQSKLNAPAKTEVGPFSKVVPSAQSVTDAANPALATDLGTLHFAVTTAVPLAQQFFDQGLRLSYGFNHGEALRAFRKAHTLDAVCAMCYWGEALVLGPNINAPMDKDAIAPAQAAIKQAQRLASKVTEKERALIDALSHRYNDNDVAKDAANAAYADAMQAVAARYPNDDDIALLYVEALMDLTPWDYWSATGDEAKGRTAEIVATIEKVLKRSPDHPGAIHFYIHMTEASSDVKRAIPYARRLAALMPGAGHLVHMPFHTFYRAGMYKDAIESNRNAVVVDEAYIARAAPVGLYPLAYYPHNVHSLMVSAQMAGDGATVLQSAEKLSRIVDDTLTKTVASMQSIKVAPYFAHAQFSDAKTILALPDPGAELPFAQAMWRYARAVGLARDLRVDAALVEVDVLAKLSQSTELATELAKLEEQGLPAQDIMQLAEQVARGRIAQARNNLPEAIRRFEAAVVLEDKLAYSEPPFWYYPVRQSLAATLIMAGDFAKAEQVLGASLLRVPNDGLALFALMTLHEKRGEAASAKAAKELLNKAWLGDVRTLRLDRI